MSRHYDEMVDVERRDVRPSGDYAMCLGGSQRQRRSTDSVASIVRVESRIGLEGSKNDVVGAAKAKLPCCACPSLFAMKAVV
jgi:hypothetical protein